MSSAAAATAGPAIAATPTAAQIATAIYTAAGSVYSAVKGQGTTVVAVSPDQLGQDGQAHRDGPRDQGVAALFAQSLSLPVPPLRSRRPARP